MHSDQYKEQFLKFLRLMYPDGLPDQNINSVSLRFGDDKQFSFVFDRSDYAIKPEKIRHTKPNILKDFEDSLTVEDQEWLQAMNVLVAKECS